MICDLCHLPIDKDDPYAVTECGRTHHACLRQAAIRSRNVEGMRMHLPGEERSIRLDPVYVLRRA